jgi:hypothetical protein
VTAERESPGQVNTQPVIVPSERHLALYQLLRSTSRPDRNGELVSWWPQARLALKLGCSLRTVQNALADLREPGIDPRHPKLAAGLRLGLIRVVPTTYRDKATGRHRLGGNAYVIVPGQHATLAEPVFPAQVNTQERDVACLNEKAPAGGAYKGRDEDERELAPLEPVGPPGMLDVGRQHEPTWAELRLDANRIVDRLRAQVGDVQILGVVGNDDPECDARLRALHTDGPPPAGTTHGSR